VTLSLLCEWVVVSEDTEPLAHPLHEAAKRGHRELMETMVLAGETVHGRDAADNTPLHWVARCAPHPHPCTHTPIPTDIYTRTQKHLGCVMPGSLLPTMCLFCLSS
jgi:hypothetical protein